MQELLRQDRRFNEMNTRRNALLPDDMPALSASERQAAFKQRQNDLGRVGRKIFATPEEHARIKVLLAEWRK